MPDYSTGVARPDYVPQSPQEQLFADLLGEGYSREAAAVASGNSLFTANPIQAALTDVERRTGGGSDEQSRLLGRELFPLPPLSQEASQADHDLYAALQGVYQARAAGDTAGTQAIIEQFVHRNYDLSQYTDPNVRNYLANLKHNTTLRDQFGFFGDNLLPAVALFVIAAGGAALTAPGGAGTPAATAAAVPAITTNTGYAGPLAAGGTLTATGGTSAGIGAGAGGGIVAGAPGAGTVLSGSGAPTAAAATGGGSSLATTLLQNAGPAANLVSGIADLAGGGGSGTTQNPETEDLYRRLRELAAQTTQPNQALALSGDAILRQRAAGSQAALLRQIAPQVRQLRQQLENAFTGLSQRFGPSGGAQVDRLKSQTVGQAGQALQQLFANAQGQAVQDRRGFLANLRPALLTQLPQLTETRVPPNYAEIARKLSGGLTLAENLLNRQPAPTQPRGPVPSFAGLAQAPVSPFVNPGVTTPPAFLTSPGLSPFASPDPLFASY